MLKEFTFVLQVQQLEDLFMCRWGKKYCPAIIDFAKATRNKSKDLLYALHGDEVSKKGTHIYFLLNVYVFW